MNKKINLIIVDTRIIGDSYSPEEYLALLQIQCIGKCRGSDNETIIIYDKDLDAIIKQDPEGVALDIVDVVYYTQETLKSEIIRKLDDLFSDYEYYKTDSTPSGFLIELTDIYSTDIYFDNDVNRYDEIYKPLHNKCIQVESSTINVPLTDNKAQKRNIKRR